MLSAEQFRKMETYFAGEMNAEEEAAFLAEVESEEALKQEFAFERQLRGAVIEHNTTQLFPPVNETAPGYANAKVFVADTLKDDEGDKKKFRLLPLSPRLRAAAIVTGLLALAALLYLLLDNRKKTGRPMRQQDMLVHDSVGKKPIDTPGTQPSPGIKIIPKQPDIAEQAFKEFYRPYTQHADKSVRLGKVIRAIEAKNYNKAVFEADHISQLMGSNDTDSVMEGQRCFYKGLARIELRKSTEAIKDFNTALEYKKYIPEMTPEIYWYRGMAYLLNGEKEAAVNDFRLLISVSPQSAYAKQAQKIMVMFRP